MRAVLMIVMLALSTGSLSCAKMYYSVQEKLGNEKRDILVNRVEKAQGDQEEAQEQFQSAFERFSELVNFDGGELRPLYDKLNREYERCESAAATVTGRIDSIEKVGQDLFTEWQGELAQYQNAELRRSSERTLRDTRGRFETMLAAMRRAEARMEPVLNAFKDQVLFLKHNLNAQAVASLQNEVGILEDTVARLISEMNESIAEANRFIDQMEKTG